MKFNSITAALRAGLVIALVAGLSGGCYLLQSAQGQLSLMSKREPIAEVIARPETPQPVRAQLRAVAAIRDFATRSLKLPDNGSYRSYADLKRRYVVWNVVVAPQFAVLPKEWCYPIVGCVAYRGYFVEARAEKFAEEQRKGGMDVAVGGVAAYSTLGHFDDPILNTMVGWNDVELAAIIFHELTHQLLYVANDASFNEALATTVEEEGVKRWLVSQGREQDLKDHLIEEQRYLAVVNLLNASRARLDALYAEPLAAEAMRAAKAQEFAHLRSGFEELKRQFGGHAPFEAWFSGEVNNAHLASVATYFKCVPGFERELARVNGDLPAFYRRVKELAKWDQKARDELVCASASH